MVFIINFGSTRILEALVPCIWTHSWLGQDGERALGQEEQRTEQLLLLGMAARSGTGGTRGQLIVVG